MRILNIEIRKAERTELTAEQKVTQKQINELKRLHRQESSSKLRGQLGWAFKHALPKGIHDPNKMVRNQHLYVGGSGKTILR